MHAQVAKNAPPLRHIGNTQLGDLVRRPAGHGLTLDVHRTGAGAHQAHDALEQGAFAHAVAPHEANGFPAGDLEVNATQDVAGAVEGVDLPDFDKWLAHASSSPR